jgi:hypothetical protein
MDIQDGKIIRFYSQPLQYPLVVIISVVDRFKPEKSIRPGFMDEKMTDVGQDSPAPFRWLDLTRLI